MSRSRRVHRALTCFAVCAALGCRAVRADDFTVEDVRRGARPENGYFSVSDPRFFILTKTEVGVPYAKPYFSAGYGIPHWLWAGIDVNAIITMEMAEAFAGVRLASPVFDVSFAVRDTWSFGKPFLQPRASYSNDQVTEAPGQKAHYVVLEGDAVATVPLPHAAIVGNLVMVDVLDMPPGQYIYDESYRLITRNPLFFVMRMAAVARFMHEDSVRVGMLAEYGFNTGREQGVWRLGPILSVQVTDHVQLNMGFTLKVSSPDHLGLTLGAYGIAGFRYMWATGEPRAVLPWHEEVIPFGTTR